MKTPWNRKSTRRSFCRLPSTRTVQFRDAFPERFVDMGIAEMDMTSTAAGMAATGLVPFVNSFAMFVTAHCYDQVRIQICYPRLHVVLAGSSAGLTQGPDGASHQSLEDVALMRALKRSRSEVHIVNTRIHDAVPGWPADWVAELPCRVSEAGVFPLPARPLPPLADGLVHAVKSYEQLTAQAAVTGSVDLALQALVAHPLGPGADHALPFWEDLLQTHAPYLPAFGGRHVR